MIPTEMLTTFLNFLYIIILRYCKRGLHICNLQCLYNEVTNGVQYSDFLDKVKDNCTISEDFADGFVDFVTKLFLRICFFKFVEKEAQRLKKMSWKRQNLLGLI